MRSTTVRRCFFARLAWFLAGAITTGAMVSTAPVLAKGADKVQLIRTKQPVAGGTHWQIRTSRNGPIHVWIPPGYNRDTAGLVVYIHGYYVDADQAWRHHRLARQFRDSRQNAMFLVPEAPRSRDERVYWKSLAELKTTVRRAGIRLPNGPSIAMAHSGGYRTIASWVDNKWLAQVILLDAMYAKEAAFDEFIDSGKRAEHRKMVIVASDTASASQAFAERFPYAVIRRRVPDSYEQLSRRERGTRLLYIRSQYGHGALVAGGEALPTILRITPLRRL